MIKNYGSLIFSGLFFCCLTFPVVSGLTPSFAADETGAEFNIKNEGVKKENIFNLFFGGAPLMPTEHGTVIIDAYLDNNNNSEWDAGEKPLERAVICVLDDVEYAVPAFIPGLENGANYSLECSSKEYAPMLERKSVFIKKRGEIIKIDVPCRMLASRSVPSPSVDN
jgi:hypothetical protein